MQNLVCLNSNTYHGFSLEHAVEGARLAGIHYIELAAAQGWTEHVSADMPDSQLRSVLTLLELSSIVPIALGGHSNLTTDEGREHFRRNLHLAHRLGVDYVVTGTGETHGDETEIDDEPALAAELRSLAALAAELGLKIGIETHGANYDTGMRVAALAALVDAPNLGVVYDTGNVVFYGGVEPYEDLEASASRVIAFHLKDKAGAQSDWDFPAIGDGDLDLPRLAGILESTGCTAPLSIEIEFTPEGPSSVDEVHTALARSVLAISHSMHTAHH